MFDQAMSSDDPTVRYDTSSHFRLRMLKDRVARTAVGAGGIGVIIAILLIFIYLLYVVFPLLQSPSMQARGAWAWPDAADAVYVGLDEQAEVGVVVDRSGKVGFFATADGHAVDSVQLPLQSEETVVSFASASPESGVHVLGLSDGRALVFAVSYHATYPNDKRVIVPEVHYPLGQSPIDVAPDGQPLQTVAIRAGDNPVLAGWTGGDSVHLVRAVQKTSFLDDSTETSFEPSEVSSTLSAVRFLILTPEQDNLYIIGANGDLVWLNIGTDTPKPIERISLVDTGHSLLDVQLLSGGISLMALDDQGVVSQWFAVRNDTGDKRLRRIRTFKPVPGARLIAPEYSRKGFLLGDEQGDVAVLHTSKATRLVSGRLGDAPIRLLSIAPRADALLALDGAGKLYFWGIHNPHPEVSWSSLWGKVWYEGYDKPDYVWQSSAANNEFEPKFSLTPLTFGTLKAAFYAMLFAIPLSILGAIYTAYFMTPRMRRMVKPTVEIMEALPTVILGFLAGLWLAPFVELHLMGVILLLLFIPLGFLLAAFLWHWIPDRLTARLPDGWEAALLIPVLALTAWFAFALGPVLDAAWFDGGLSAWLSHRMGIDFDQRNSLVVGIAMGFAVIPTIFSIAEDAIFGVPRHLTNGSLALGATPWQTLMRVVLLTASPGIFSGIMMGFGRAVGETMIVLMATGNTPVMNMSIFQGMRTLSANIAVEMPESEVGSTHFRILFLAALVLFMFTFLFNTVAEVVRQRLRRKYSNL